MEKLKMKTAAIGWIGRTLRKPWYLLWNFIEKRWYEGHEYTLQVPFGHRVFTPWFATKSEFDFAKMLELVRSAGPLVVSPDRCYMLYQFCRRSLSLDGAAAECGVYTGSTAHLLSLVMSSHSLNGRELHLFDTFSGMPDLSIPERDYHSPGDFSDTSLDYVRRRLQPFPFVKFHPGKMPDTFNQVAAVPAFSFVHVDVDIYPSVFECCKWFWPRLCPGGVIVFDDYGFYPYRYAARAAVDDFFSSLGERPIIVLPTGQAVAIKP